MSAIDSTVVTPNDKIKPMGLKLSLLFFFVPSIIMIINVNIIMGIFNNNGLPIFYNYNIIYGLIPLLIMLLASIYFYKREGNPINWSSFKSRFRLGGLSKVDILWIISLFIVMLAGTVVFAFTPPILAKIVRPPSFWPDEINPLKSKPTSMTSIPTTFMKEPLTGNWMVAVYVLIDIIVVSFAEEFWWRGYILPRQELKFGKNTWIVHGILWDLFHLFTPWNIIALLPGTLALSYVAQKRRKTWIVIITHGLADGLITMTIIVLAILK